MKKIIEGKLYNTETADLIAEYDNGESGFHWYCESLYRTKKGSFFIAGEGGAMTHYSRSCGDNNWTGGEGLRAITKSEAREWMENFVSSDEYEKCFGTPEEA